MIRKCQGCGVTLQTTNQAKAGYIPDINKGNYCERCYKIIHYNKHTITKLPSVNKYLIEKINKQAKYVYFLLDFLNINSETINTFKNIKVPKTLIISKLDIIPKSIKKENITAWLKEEYKIKNDIIYQSTQKNINTRTITKYLEDEEIKEVYVLGYANAGKSTLLNKIISLNNLSNQTITTSSIPNTTTDFIPLKLNDDITIIDSPGFTPNDTFYQDDEFNLIERISSKNTIDPITYQMKETTNILIEDRFSLKTNSKNSITLYLSNRLNIKKIFKDQNIENSEEITIDIPDNSDLVIKTLGFINIKKACQLTIKTTNKNLIEVRKSMF